jgi:hypothetical protein
MNRLSRPARLPLVLLAVLCGAIITLDSASVLAAEAYTPPVRSRVVLERAATEPDLETFAAAMEQGRDPAPEMTRVDSFTSRYPFDGQPASERTVVYLSFDEENLYAVWLCFDSQPELIRAPVRRRDNIPDEDDSVAFQIDTFKDQAHLQGFQSSANGAINDGTYTEGQGWDLSNDADWRREGRLTANGYVIKMVIPFRALRFPPGEQQEWGFLMFRGIGRKNEAVFFPQFSTTIGSRMLQTGTLAGIEVTPDPHRWQLTPFVTAEDTSTRDVPTGSPWNSERKQAVGVDGKLVWKDRLVWDFTVNPDFSQVESDEPQVLTNQRFEVFFPEKRPFFIENASYFGTPINLLFTRRIVDPSVGLRLTGQTGRWAVSGLAIEDDNPPETFGVPGTGGATLWYGGLRRRGDDDSSLGGLLMHRRGPQETADLLSVDGRQRLDDQWIASFQIAGSHVAADAGSTGPEGSGLALYGALNGSGQLWTYSLVAQDIDAGFHAPVGFVPRLGIRDLTQSASKRFEVKQPWLVGIGPYLETKWVWDEDGTRLDESLRLRLDAELPRATWVYAYFDAITERVTPADFPALAAATSFDQQRVGVSWRSAFSAQFLFAGEVFQGDYVNFVPAAGQAPRLGDGRSSELALTYFPTTRLELAATLLGTRHDEVNGAPVFETRIARLKVNYHLDHAWQLRLIVDEADTRGEPTRTSLTTQRSLNYDALLQWLPSPGNAFYFGVAHRRAALPALGRPGLDEPGDLQVAGKSVFLKYSRRFDF